MLVSGRLSKLTLYLIAGFCGLSLLYSNCGRVGEGGLLTSSSKPLELTSDQLQCELEKKEAYGRTYFPFLKESCGTCHYHKSAHASLNIDVSMNSFLEIGETKIVYQATHSHGGNSAGWASANAATLVAIKAEWQAALDDYATCMTNAGVAPEVSNFFNLRLASKTIPDLSLTKDNQALWVPVEWDLAHDVDDGSKGKVKGIFTAEAQIWMHATRPEVVGISLRNPSIRLDADNDVIYVGGIKVYLNDTYRSAATNYNGLNRSIEGTSMMLLSESIQGVSDSLAGADTLLGFELVDLNFSMDADGNPVEEPPVVAPTPTPTPATGPTPTPTPEAVVTYSDLMSGPPVLRIFGQNCVSCHQTGNAQGGLNLDDYNQTKNKAFSILSRMNSGSMPPSGKLPATQIEKVQNWINGGTPE